MLNLPRRALVVGNPDAGQIVVAVGSHHCTTRESSDVRLYTEKAIRRFPTTPIIRAASKTEKGRAQRTVIRIFRFLRPALFSEDPQPLGVIKHGQRRFAQVSERSVR